MNTPHALSRLLEEQLRNQCLSPQTDNDDSCTPFANDGYLMSCETNDSYVSQRRIMEREIRDEFEDELMFLRNENAELRLVVAQLRSYISTIQRDSRRASVCSPTPNDNAGDLQANLKSLNDYAEGGEQAAHSLRQDLLKMFSRHHRSKGIGLM